jgi:hypothetical protein
MARSNYVATETAGRFTGVYLALYATGRGEETSESVVFSAFAYDERRNAGNGRATDSPHPVAGAVDGDEHQQEHRRVE